MEINVLDGEIYVPTLGGNDKNEKPITFHLRYLTVEDQTEVEYFEFIQMKSGNKVSVKVNSREIFKRGVESIDNLTVNQKPITMASEYLAIRGSKYLADLLSDVAGHLNKAAEINAKN